MHMHTFTHYTHAHTDAHPAPHTRTELRHKLSLELNFLNEIRNARQLGTILHNRRECSAPYMHEELSSPRLIIMEWVDGTKVRRLWPGCHAAIEP